MSGSEGSIGDGSSLAGSKTDLASTEDDNGHPPRVHAVSVERLMLASRMLASREPDGNGGKNGDNTARLVVRERSGSGEGVVSEEAALPEHIEAIKASDELLATAVKQAAWRQRLRKRGHMFCRLYWEWMQEVCDSLDPATPAHFVAWHLLPGFKTMLICMLLEMRARSVVTYSECVPTEPNLLQ